MYTPYNLKKAVIIENIKNFNSNLVRETENLSTKEILFKMLG